MLTSWYGYTLRRLLFSDIKSYTHLLSATNFPTTLSSPRLDAAILAAAMVLTLLGALGHNFRTGPSYKITGSFCTLEFNSARSPFNLNASGCFFIVTVSPWQQQSISFYERGVHDFTIKYYLTNYLFTYVASTFSVPRSDIFLMSSPPQRAPLGTYRPVLNVLAALVNITSTFSFASMVGEPSMKSHVFKNLSPYCKLKSPF